MIAYVQQWFTRHRSFLFILFLFANFRLLALLLLRPGGFITNYSEFDFYYAWGQLRSADYHPFVNTWSVYPPLVPALMFPAFELASRIPPWVEPKLFFTFVLGLEFFLFDFGTLIILYRLANRLALDTVDRTFTLSHPVLLSSRHPVILYALLFAPLQTMLGFYDGVSLFFLLLALDLLTACQRWGWIGSALAVALGFLTKLTPIILIPVALRWLWSTSYLRNSHYARWLQPLLYFVLTSSTIILIGYPLVGGNLELGLSSLRIQNIRPPWQSIWALIDGYYGFGLVPIDMRNLAGLRTYHWETHIPWLWVTMGFGVAYLWLYTRRFDWTKVHTVYSFTALSMVGLLLYSKGWSPQFLVWVVAFVVVLLPTIRGISLVVLLTLINVVESFVYLILLPDQTWILFGTVIARTLLLLLLAVDFLALIWQQETTAQIMQRFSHVASWIVIAATLLVGVVTMPRTVNAYWDRRLAEHPCKEAIEYLQSEVGWPNQTIITYTPEDWQELYPWLRQYYQIKSLDFYNIQNVNNREEIRRRLFDNSPESEFWFYSNGKQGQQILDEHFLVTFGPERRPAALFWIEYKPAFSWIPTGEPPNPTWRCDLARMRKVHFDHVLGTLVVKGGKILLLGMDKSELRPSHLFRFALFWSTEAGGIAESYTVFTQLFDESGKLIAQKDNLPVRGEAPTNLWSHPIIRDPYELSIPVDAPPGTYQLHVGMYDSTVTRLPITLADGSVVDHFTFVVEVTP